MDNVISLPSIEKIDSHRALWDLYEPVLFSGHLPQALLLLGPKHAHMLTFASRWITTMLCESLARPCGMCRSCEMIKNGFHPDLVILTKEEGASAIKIDQIRALQDTIYQSPSWQQYRVVLIYPIDALNLAASNAILKLLEEPPVHVKFILISESHQVLPTLLSRCQRFYFNAAESFRQLEFNYMNLVKHYPENSERYQLAEKRLTFCTTIERLFKYELSICQVARDWQKIDLEDFVWFFYLFVATCIIKMKLGLSQGDMEYQVIQHLCERFRQPMHLYTVLDKATDLMRILKQNITLNHDLVIETLLLSLIEEPYAST